MYNLEAGGEEAKEMASEAASKPSNSPWELNSNSLPNDIAINIASFLEASDVCSLGSCSRFWRDLCASDCIWMSLSRKRWPALALGSDASPSFSNVSKPSADADSFSSTQGWKGFYISKHREMAVGVAAVIKFVEQCSHNESIEVGYYLKAICELCSMGFGFKDVQLFLITTKHSVLLNLLGLHYSISYLGVPPNDVMEALNNGQVSERQVCISWFKLGRWFYGFRLHDESRSRRVSLSELTMAKEEEVLGVLNRGAVHEVIRVHIKSVTARSWLNMV